MGAETSGVPISSAHCTALDCLGCNLLAVKGKYELTYNLDDLGQEHAISHILLEVLDEAFVARFGEVMIGPIGVDLQKKSIQATSGIWAEPTTGSEATAGIHAWVPQSLPCWYWQLANSGAARAINIQGIVLARHSASCNSPGLLRRLCQGLGKS